MIHLYAYPDADVVDELLPYAKDTYLRQDKALRRIAQIPGLIPIAIDPGGGRDGYIYWADFGDRSFREWQFMYSVKELATQPEPPTAFVTDISILLCEDLVADSIDPKGFIFHTSRCGSTLFAKALSRDPAHVVLNQPGPLQQGFWAYLTQQWDRHLEPSDQNIKMFRHLLLAMTRKRHAKQTTAFVKFISWNALYVDFIQQAFPDVPCLFMYRNPIEVIASVRKETTAALVAKMTPQASFLSGLSRNQVTSSDDTDYLACCFARYFEAILAVENIAVINYDTFNSSVFKEILDQAFKFEPSARSYRNMAVQFAFDAKDDGDQVIFKPDSQSKKMSVTKADQHTINQRTDEPYRRLEASDRNLSNTMKDRILSTTDA